MCRRANDYSSSFYSALQSKRPLAQQVSRMVLVNGDSLQLGFGQEALLIKQEGKDVPVMARQSRGEASQSASFAVAQGMHIMQ